MTAVGFGVLSAMIGLAIFGSAMALGFQASTTILPFGAASDAPAVSLRDTSVSYAAAEESSETSGMAGPAVLKGSISAPPMVRVAAGALDSDERLAFGGISTGAERAAAKEPVRLKRTSVPADGISDAAPQAEKGAAAGHAAGANGSHLAAPLTGAVAQGAAPSGKSHKTFETSTPMQLSTVADGSDGDTVIFEYPIPPMRSNAELQLGEDPLASAALEVPHGTRQPLNAGFALLSPAASAKAAPKAGARPASTGLLSGNFVLSFNLTDDQLMLVFMVTGLLAVATFLWLASSWLSDRSSLRRQRQWDRQQAAALAEAEAADLAENGAGERAAA